MPESIDSYIESSKALVFAETPITSLDEARIAVYAIDFLSNKDRKNNEYENIANMKEALNKRLSASGFVLMYSEQEQMYILY